MQFVRVSNSTTLSDLIDIVGKRNIDSVLSLNDMTRSLNIGQSFNAKCNEVASNSATPNVTSVQKLSLLNSMTDSSDIFEKASLSTESEWKVLNTLNTFKGYMRLPDELTIPASSNVLGNDLPVAKSVYREVRTCIQMNNAVDPEVFSSYQYVQPSGNYVDTLVKKDKQQADPFQMFHIPWGEITLHSSIDDDSADFPVYPEEISDGVKANYNQMPDLLYQYEPWQVYQSSGPRDVPFTFHFHRDMWTGDHRDGMANKLIRFCEANCYPEYNGSAVNAPISTLYIGGKEVISGVMTSCTTDWEGPIGLDGWYLECTLKISITEVSKRPLNYSVVKNKNLIGW